MCNVNVATGELIRHAVDFFLPGYIPVEISRLYRSTLPVVGWFGRGWAFNLDIRLELKDGVVTAFDGSPDGVPLTRRGEGKWSSHDGVVALAAERSGLILRIGDGRERVFPLFDSRSQTSRIASLRDPNGNSVDFKYADDRLESIRDTVGRVLTFHYDSESRIVDVILLESHSTAPPVAILKYKYAAGGDLAMVQDEMGRVRAYETVDALLVRETDPRQDETFWCYDAARRCVRTWRTGGQLLRVLAFDHDRRRSLVLDSLGVGTVYTLDEAGRVVTITNALAETETRVYDGSGGLIAATGSVHRRAQLSVFDKATNRLTEVNASGAEIRTYFDDANRIITAEEDGVVTFAVERDERGRIVRRTDLNGGVWKFEYAQRGYVTKAVNPQGHAVYQHRSEDGRSVRLSDDIGPILESEYDGRGSLISVRNAASRMTRFRRDAACRLRAIESPDGSVRTIEYDGNDNAVLVTDELGRSTRYEFDALDRPIRETNPLGQSLSLRYDTEGRLVGISNWKGEQTSIAYDPLGRPRSATFFDGATETYGYDDAGNLALLTDAAGRRTEFQYRDGQLTAKLLSDGDRIELQHVRGLLAGASNGASTIAREFDRGGRLLMERQGTVELHYEYDSMDNLVRMWDSAGRDIHYGYDGRRRLIALAEEGAESLSFRYDRLDLLVEQASSTGIVHAMTYDDLDRLTSVSSGPQGERPSIRREFAYDRVGNLTREAVDTTGQKSVRVISYDALDRILEVNRDGAKVEWYQYDAGSNITACHLYASAVMGPGNRLLRAGETEFQYDSVGNIVARKGTAGSWKYDYSPDGRLVRVSDPAGRITTFVYDAIGRRISKTSDGKSTQFAWDGETLFTEESRDGRVRYTFLPSSFVPVVIERDGARRHVALDQLGAAGALLSAGGQLEWLRDDSAYGVPSEGARYREMTLGCPGQYGDPETGLRYNFHRYYDPTVGRFLSPDPIGLSGGTNFYRYVRNPLVWIDPVGLFEISVSARCDWNADQLDDFKGKVKRYNQAIEQRQRKGDKGLTISPCDRESMSLKDLYEKCGKPKGEPSTQSPLNGGKATDCKDDIDHIIDVQMGGAQKYPEACKNLVPVNASVNRSLGSQVKNQIDSNMTAADKVLTAVKIGERECPDKTPRTPACG